MEKKTAGEGDRWSKKRVKTDKIDDWRRGRLVKKKTGRVINWWRRRLEEVETGGEGVCWRRRLIA